MRIYSRFTLFTLLLTHVCLATNPEERQTGEPKPTGPLASPSAILGHLGRIERDLSQRDVKGLPGPRACKHLMDMVVVVDGSDKINSKDFMTLKRALVDLLDALNLSHDQQRFGVVLYSTSVADPLPLSAYKIKLRTKILALRQPRDGTRTDLGIKEMRDIFRDQGRENVPKVGIVITSSQSKYPHETSKQAFLAKTEGITMFAVGVSELVDKSELDAIASDMDKVFTVDTFDQLKATLERLVLKLCPTTTTSPTTTTTTTTTPPPTTTTTP